MDHTSYKFKDGRNKKVRFSQAKDDEDNDDDDNDDNDYI